MHVLVVDDQTNFLRTATLALRGMGHETEVAENGSQALTRLRQHPIEVAFLDLRLGHEDGLEVLPKMLEQSPGLAVIVFTAHSTIESAVEAMRRGAFDYLSKPFVPDQIRQKLDRLQVDRRLQHKVEALESELRADRPSIQLESAEPEVQAVLETAFRAAPSEASVLLLGPSGTGKTVLARQIHERSTRAAERFVTVHCPSLSRELLESELFGHVKGAFTGATGETWGKVAQADGGTLFLDEVGELPLEVQPKLLRLLQDREYERVGEVRVRRADLRLITATNRDLAAEVAAGRFREDLYYRLNVISLEVPALRHRRADLVSLADGFLEFFRRRAGRHELTFSPAAREAFLQYDWPGNLRELRNVIERAAILSRGDRVELADLPTEMRGEVFAPSTGDREPTLAELEERQIRRIVAQSKTLAEAAEILGIDEVTLYRKRKKMGLTRAPRDASASSL